MKVKTSELTGPALNRAVAEALGHKDTITWSGSGWNPSTDWSQGGPLVERERMTVTHNEDDGCWEAYYPDDVAGYQRANSPLIAAMRCYVASKLGDEVDVPEELV